MAHSISLIERHSSARSDEFFLNVELVVDHTTKLATQTRVSWHAGSPFRGLAQFGDDIVPVVRVGIALGEEVFADDTVTGPGVVLAQRVEQLSEPGGVCVTSAIHEAIPQRMPFDQESLGEQAVKGFDEPVRVYRVALKSGAAVPAAETSTQAQSPSQTRRLIVAFAAVALVVAGGVVFWLKPWAPEFEPASVERMTFPLPDKPSIAVLPFANMSDDPKQEYFVDGMTEDLITDLSKLSGLFVIARNSVFTYKGKSVKVRRVAEELGVRYVLEGSVRRAGEQVRINAQLIDATTGGHLWAERYDGTLNDVFALQDKVTQKIVTALAVTLTAGEAEQVARKGTNNVAAYDAFLQGWAHYIRDTPDGFAKAIPYFEKAVALDPNYGRAYAALAAVYYVGGRTREWWLEWGLDPYEPIRRTHEYLQQALQNPTPLAHAVASLSAIDNGRHEEGILEAERAIALDANDPTGYVQMAHALTMAGKPKEAVPLVEKAMRLNPHYPPTYLWVLGLAHFGMEQFDKAATLFERTHKRTPALLGTLLGAVVASTYGHLGRKQEAKALLEGQEKWFSRAWPGRPYNTREAIYWYNYKDSADKERLVAGLRKAGLE